MNGLMKKYLFVKSSLSIKAQKHVPYKSVKNFITQID